LLHGQAALAAGVDPDWLSLAEHRAPSMHRAAALMEQLPFPDESFDLLVCSWVLEHLAQPQRAFAEAARVLSSPTKDRPGGHLVFLAPNAWHPLAWVNRALGQVGAWQGQLVQRLYDRAEADTFPTLYRANTRRRITQLAQAAGLEPVAFYAVGDPTYLAFNELFYRLAVLAERLTPGWMKVHLSGDLVKK
jgi:ubiquinone/menaquinone biosynthesis C-methylase UbiE